MGTCDILCLCGIMSHIAGIDKDMEKLYDNMPTF